jgi:cell division protein FtsZ
MISDGDTTMLDAFRHADAVLLNAVQGISDLITVGGYINVDFADVKSVMCDMGMALMGSGTGVGERRAEDAAEMAISSPLLDNVTIDGATGVLINITGGLNLGIQEINKASSIIEEAAHPEANIIFGAVIDESMQDEVKVTVIATGFDRAADGLPTQDQREFDEYQTPQRRRPRTANPMHEPRNTMQPAPAEVPVAAPRATPGRPTQAAGYGGRALGSSTSELAPVYGQGRQARVLTTEEFEAFGSGAGAEKTGSELSDYLFSREESGDEPPLIRRSRDYSR